MMHPSVEDVDGTPHTTTSQDITAASMSRFVHSVTCDNEGVADQAEGSTEPKLAYTESKTTLC